MALIPLAVLLLQFPISLPLWNVLPKLRFLQFPWRWLVVLEAPLGIFFAAAIWPTRRWLRVVVIVSSSLIFLFITTVTTLLFHQTCDAEDAVVGMLSAFRSGQGFEGTDEYAPPGADNTLMAVGLPDACLTSNPAVVLAKSDDGNTPEWDPTSGHCDATYSWQRQKGRCLARTPAPRCRHPARRLPYPSPARLCSLEDQRQRGDHCPWSAPELRISSPPRRRPDGCAGSEGSVRLDVDWITTGDVVMGRLLSLMSLGYFTVLFLIERKLNVAQKVEGEPRLS